MMIMGIQLEENEPNLKHTVVILLIVLITLSKFKCVSRPLALKSSVKPCIYEEEAVW